MPVVSSVYAAVSSERLVVRSLEPLMADVSGATDNADALGAMTAASVVYLAETHNEALDHMAQLEIIQSLNAQNEIVIALEMFQRPFQPVLDAYLVGELTETELIAQSEYETRWGFDWEFYAPILRYAKENQIALVALNTPAEITRQVAQEGLASLSGRDFQFVPPIDDIDTSDEEYRALIQAVFSAHGDHGNSDMGLRIFLRLRCCGTKRWPKGL